MKKIKKAAKYFLAGNAAIIITLLFIPAFLFTDQLEPLQKLWISFGTENDIQDG